MIFHILDFTGSKRKKSEALLRMRSQVHLLTYLPYVTMVENKVSGSLFPFLPPKKIFITRSLNVKYSYFCLE